MKKFTILIFLAFLAAFFELAFSGIFGGKYSVSLLVPLVFFATIYRNQNEAAVFAASSGFFYDISSENRFFFVTLFLIFEMVILSQLKNRVINFENHFVEFITLALLILLKVTINLVIFWWGTFYYYDLAKIVIFNLIFVLIVIFGHFSYKYFLPRFRLIGQR